MPPVSHHQLKPRILFTNSTYSARSPTRRPRSAAASTPAALRLARPPAKTNANPPHTDGKRARSRKELLLFVPPPSTSPARIPPTDAPPQATSARRATSATTSTKRTSDRMTTSTRRKALPQLENPVDYFIFSLFSTMHCSNLVSNFPPTFPTNSPAKYRRAPRGNRHSNTPHSVSRT